MRDNDYRVITKYNLRNFLELIAHHPEQLNRCNHELASHIYGGVFITPHWICDYCGKDLGEPDPD